MVGPVVDTLTFLVESTRELEDSMFPLEETLVVTFVRDPSSSVEDGPDGFGDGDNGQRRRRRRKRPWTVT